MKKTLELLISILFILTFTCCSNHTKDIRLRILANSDSKDDQTIKIKVKNFLQNYLKTKDLNNLDLTKMQNDLNHQFKKIKVERKYVKYEAKAYHEKMIPSGYYDTILITIGNGKGKNFWTLLYPEFFNISFEDDHEIEYHSYFYDYLFNSYIYTPN